MNRSLVTLALTTALLAAPSLPALAQAGSQADVDQATARLGEWGFTEVRFDEWDDARMEFHAKTSDGASVEIDIATDGTIHSLDVEGDGTSAALLALLPEGVRAQAEAAGITAIDDYERDDDSHEIEGIRADGGRVEIDLPL